MHTTFPLWGPASRQHREFLMRIILDHHPYAVSPTYSAGAPAEIAYGISGNRARMLAKDTRTTIPPSALSVQIKFFGGTKISSWRDAIGEMRYFLSQEKQWPPSVPTRNAFCVFHDNQPTLSRDTRYTQITPLLQNGFSHASAFEMNLFFRDQQQWLRNIFTACDVAQTQFLMCVQTLLSAEIQAHTISPQEPDVWNAYGHLCLCPGKKCRAFAQDWDMILTQSKANPWTHLYERHENTFKTWGVAPL